MKNEVFITETASFFPNNPIDNNSIENYLGLILSLIHISEPTRH